MAPVETPCLSPRSASASLRSASAPLSSAPSGRSLPTSPHPTRRLRHHRPPLCRANQTPPVHVNSNIHFSSLPRRRAPGSTNYRPRSFWLCGLFPRSRLNAPARGTAQSCASPAARWGERLERSCARLCKCATRPGHLADTTPPPRPRQRPVDPPLPRSPPPSRDLV